MLLICLVAAGNRPGLAPHWMSLALPQGETNKPIESESRGDSEESSSEEEAIYYAHRGQRSLRLDRAHGKLPLNTLTAHFSQGRGFLMVDGRLGSEHARRNGTGAHLRC